MKYIIIGLLCLVITIVFLSIVLSKNKNENKNYNEIIISKNTMNDYKTPLDKIDELKLEINNILNGSFFTYDDKIYCIGREYERSPLSIFTVSPNTEYISDIKLENYTLEDPKYLGYYDEFHYFIAVNADEYFSIWKESNDTNYNYKIYQCIIKLDENFQMIGVIYKRTNIVSSCL